MHVPFLDLREQYKAIRHEIDPSIAQILENATFILGKPVSDFEQAFAAAHQVRHCVGVSSGTDANHLALWALSIGPGDEVIIPANTFIATAWSATLCGATPVFVDCHPESYNIDPELVEAAMTPRTKAIMAVHLYGQSADIQSLERIAQKHGVHVVEDAAQAHLCEYEGKRVGGFGVTAAFSFYPGKNLGAYGEAGAVTTNDDALAAKLRMLREHGQSEKYHHEIFGHNYRMEAIQGAVLGVKLKHLEQWTVRRRAVARRYDELLSGISEVQVPKEMSYGRHVYHLYVLQVERRAALKKHLDEKGIGNGYHYPIPLHLQKAFAHLGYRKGYFPVSEALASNGLSLPMYPELTDDQIQYVCDAIRSFYGT